MEKEHLDIMSYIETNKTAKELYNSCFRQDNKKYYFSKKLLKFERIESEKQLISLVAYDFPEIKQVELTKTGKEIISLNLEKTFFDIVFFMNTIDMIKTAVDPFQNEKVVFKRFDRTLELITNELLIRETFLDDDVSIDTYNIICNDYKEHFKDFNRFLDWIIACRFTNNRRSSYLHFWVTAGFGKSFLSACFKKCGIVTECRYEDFKSPSSLSPFELINSWIVLIDEFSIFKKEFKNLTNQMIVDAKNQLRTIVDVYAKVFLSAEQSPSFEDGVDKQITDRVQQITPITTSPLEDRDIYIKYGNSLYVDCISKYIYDYITEQSDSYIKAGKSQADIKATKTLKEFLNEYRLKTEALDDVLYQLFYNKIFDINNENDFDSLSRNDQFIKKDHIFKKEDGTFILANPKKVFSLIIEQEDSNFYKKAQFKTNGLDVVLKVEKKELMKNRKFGNKQKRGIVINPLDFYYDENEQKYKRIISIDKDGNIIDTKTGKELF